MGDSLGMHACYDCRMRRARLVMISAQDIDGADRGDWSMDVMDVICCEMTDGRGERREERGQKREETQLCLCRVAPAVLGEVR